MRFFILDKEGSEIEVGKYLQAPGIDAVFAQFIRREALDEVIIEQSNHRPAYLVKANKLGFNWEPNAEIGHVQYDYKANLMRRLVQEYARKLVHELGMPVYEVNGANMFSMQHPVVDAYASLYGDRLYQFQSGKSDLVMSYDASYPQFNLASRAPLSYKQLPFAHYSLTDCYRHEQSGELMLLLRQRRFYMPDLHPYFRDIAEAFAWLPNLQAKIVEAGNAANRAYQVIVEIPSEKVWREYRKFISMIPVSLSSDVLVNIIDDGKDRYWVVNIDFKILDKLGQAREIACIQVDADNAKRLNIRYIDEHGSLHHPIIIHSAIPGGIERYMYIQFDNHEEDLPLWISPVQVRLLPVGGDYVSYCKKLVERYSQLPLRIEIDDRSNSVSSKLKSAHLDFVPHKIVIGQSEVDSDSQELNELLEKLAAEVRDMPFMPREWPIELSKQV